MHRRHWLWAGTLLAVLLVAGFLVQVAWIRPAGIEAPQPAARPDVDKMIAAAAARIAAESRRPLPPPVVQAAPGVRSRADSAGARPDSLPTPPEGYAFVEHFGAMAKARIEGRTGDAPRDGSGPDWLDSPDAIAALTSQAAAAGRDWSFGWIRLAGEARRTDLGRALADTDAAIVGSSGPLVRARLPGDAVRLREIAALDQVDGLGATPAAAKLVAFDDGNAPPGADPQPVYVTLMDEDTDGHWRRAMEDLGAVVGGYDPALRVYRANADRGVIEALAAADFVLAVEPIRLVEATHDTAVPAMGADALRAYDGAPGIFSGTGGVSVPIAVMDTGLNINHLDIASHRDSICGANFAYNSGWFGADGPLIEDDDLWIDDDGHGTHVTATVAGNGFGQQRFAGMAPGVRHIRFAKVLDSVGFGFGDSIPRGMDFLAQASRCSEAGRMSARVKPLIVNMSLSRSARIFRGRGVGARKLDSTVWSHRQLYVVAQSNAGISGFSNYGAAKNSLAVGAAMDSGDLASFSSHGPTADGRLAPNVVGTGVRVYSAKGQGSRSGYVAFNGTSMSSPAVAGVAALLMDAVPAHREHPALTRARLMASAVRPDPWLADGAGFTLDNSAGPGPLQARFGMGKVSARTAALQRDAADGWQSSSATTELTDGEYAYHDINVPAGASRLDLVMTWDEPPADAVASTVLNDLDLWLDRDADCETAACGEHVSRSRVDNVEWIVVRNPEPGTYRVKVLAHRVYTAAPRAAVAWTVIRGASTPALGIEADRERIVATGTHELTLTLTSDAYLAAGTRLRVDCRTGGSSRCNDLVTIESAALLREDGLTVGLEDEQGAVVPSGYPRTSKPVDLGAPLPIGEIAVGDSRKIVFLVSVQGNAEADETRLYFTASAWNAHSASVSVGVGSGDTTVHESVRPANDAFAAATLIEGEAGSLDVDLLHATPEPGEPVFDARLGRPAASVWYTWTAPADGSFRFRVPALAGDYRQHDDIARHDRVHVFTGDAIAALHEVASAPWHATFFAERGSTYRIRVSGVSRAVPMDLRWSPGDRPVNDDFAEAVVLEGESGSFDGSSAGATLEPGESFGRLAATTWFRWAAPDDGRWGFQAPGRRVLVFAGADIAALRLVGSRPSSTVQVPAGVGREYRIAVAEGDVAGLGGDYALRWYPITHAIEGFNDAFEEARSLGGEASSEYIVDVDSTSTVEPGEPAETGVRTKWWEWQAPEDGGLHTWRLQDAGEAVPSYPKMRVTLWTGTAVNDLVLAAEIGPGAPFEALLDAVGGATYRIAAGLRNGDATAYEQFNASAKLIWGATPDNDDPSGAATVSGASGSISGSTASATGARGERSAVLGRSTLWWTFEAGESGWVRFAVDGEAGPWALTVHRDAADGLGGLDVLASSVWQRSDGNAVEVLFEAEAGVRYTIALGVRGGGRGGEFTLGWEAAEAPAWLRYAGRLADGDHDSGGDPVEIRGLRDLAAHATQSLLYLASELGLQVFEQDPATGRLDQVQLLDTALGADVSLIWDPQRNRLLADDCGTWRSFEPGADGRQLSEPGELAVAADPGNCARELLMDATGSDVYRVWNSGLDHFRVEDGGGLRFVASVDGAISRGAVLSNDGATLYAVDAGRGLHLFERDTATGVLTRTDHETPLSVWHSTRLPIAISDDDAYLFVFDRTGDQTNLFSLADRLNPERLATLSKFWGRSWQAVECRFADSRTEGVVVDVFCPGTAFTARWDSEAAELAGADFITPEQVDRSGGSPMPDFDALVDLAVSADDGHLYVATPNHGILIFARGGSPAAAESTGMPDLVIQRAWSSTAAAATGASFELSALVRNRGSGRAAAATLRFYRSANTTISSLDVEVGSLALDALAAAGTRSRSVDVTAPAAARVYYYGACVDDVADESETKNNCSQAVSVTVTQGAPDLVVEGISVDESTLDAGASFTLSGVARNRGYGTAAATTVRYYRSDDTRVSAADLEVGTDNLGALAAGNHSVLSIDLDAPAEPGTVYYGACVDAVSGEAAADNNCSAAVAVTVQGTAGDSYCRAGGVVAPGGSCGIYGTDHTFDVDANGQGCLRAAFTLCAGGRISLRSATLTFVADRHDDLSWEIEEIDPAPPQEPAP